MESPSLEVYLHNVLKNSTYDEIVNLCQTSQKFRDICEYNFIWRDLLKRDFDITYNGEDARNLYLQYKNTLDHFSEYYPIITNHALQALVMFVPISSWPIIDKKIKRNRQWESSQILSIKTITTLLNNLKFLTYITYDMPEIGINSIGKERHNQIIQQLKQSGCSQLIEMITKPTLIFVRKNPKIINHDYDLATNLVDRLGTDNFMLMQRCAGILTQLHDYILG
jgi:hypothetical protein